MNGLLTGIETLLKPVTGDADQHVDEATALRAAFDEAIEQRAARSDKAGEKPPAAKVIRNNRRVSFGRRGA